MTKEFKGLKWSERPALKRCAIQNAAMAQKRLAIKSAAVAQKRPEFKVIHKLKV